MDSQKRYIGLQIVVVIIAVGIAIPGFYTYFLLDDYPWIKYTKENVESLSEITTTLTTPNKLGFYRPSMALVWMFFYVYTDLSTTAIQAYLVLLWALIIVYINRLTSLFCRQPAGIIAALLFVSYVPAFELTWYRAAICLWGEICFVLMAAFYLIKGTREPVSWKSLILAYICAIIAFGTKESSLVFPLAFFTLKGRKIKIAALGLLLISSFFVIVPRYQANRLNTFPARKLALARIIQEGNPVELFNMKLQIINNFDLFIFENYFQRFTIIMFILAFSGFYITRKNTNSHPENTGELDYSRNRFICGLIYMGLLLSILHYAMDSFIFNVIIFIALLIIMLSLIRNEVVRFFLIWIVLFFIPPFLMGVGTRHQMLESAAGLVCVLSIGLLHIWDWWLHRFSGKADHSFTISDHLVQLCVPLSLIFIVITILLHLTVEPGQILSSRIHYSKLNKDVCSYLVNIVTPGSEITATRLPGMISSYDILLELQMRDKKFDTNTISEYFSDTADYSVIAGETNPYGDRLSILNRFHVLKKFERGPYFAEIYRKTRPVAKE